MPTCSRVPRPAVTVVTPTFDAARFVGRCVESVLAQSSQDWELIVADDGSRDGTPEVVERYRDPRIRVIRLPHRGLGALADTYNLAFRAGTGALVAILEGDDAWPPDKLAVQVRGFDDPSVVLSWGRGLWIDEEDRPLRLRRELHRDRVLDPRRAFRRLAKGSFLVPSVTVMLRRAALLRAGGFCQDGSRHFVDLPTWLAVLAATGGRVRYHDHVLGHWRRHPKQASCLHGVAMRTEGWRVVRAIAAGLDPDARVRAGADDGLARANRARWAVSCARKALDRGRTARARRLYAAALAIDLAAAAGKGLPGLASSALGVNLPAAWRRLRGRG